MMMQTSANVLYNSAKELFLHFGIQEVENQTSLWVREKYKTLLSYSYEGRKDIAIAYISKANEKYLQFFMNVLHALASETRTSSSIRNCFKQLIDPMSSFYSQLAIAYVNMHSDLYTLLLLSKTFSVDKIAEIIQTSVDQVDKALIPFFMSFQHLHIHFIPQFQNRKIIHLFIFKQQQTFCYHFNQVAALWDFGTTSLRLVHNYVSHIKTHCLIHHVLWFNSVC